MRAIFLHESRVLRARAVRLVRRVLPAHALHHGFKHVLVHVLRVLVVGGAGLQDEQTIVVGGGVT
jgi:hypothetical protein